MKLMEALCWIGIFNPPKEDLHIPTLKRMIEELHDYGGTKRAVDYLQKQLTTESMRQGK